MNWKVWRRQDGSVAGYCEESNTMFEPGGDVSTYTVSIDKDQPVIADPPKSNKQLKLEALLASGNVPQEVKDYLAL